MNSRFRLIVKFEELVLYQAVFSFSDEQYQSLLATYKGPHMAHTNQYSKHVIEGVLEKEGKGEAYSLDKDYSDEFPDAVIAMLILRGVKYDPTAELRHSFSQTHYYTSKRGSLTVEKNIDKDSIWTCERIEDAVA